MQNMPINQIMARLVDARTWALIGETEKAKHLLTEIAQSASLIHKKRIAPKVIEITHLMKEAR